jgi:N utilization substance protein A
MKINVWNSIQLLSKERGVETSVIVNAIKESLRVASANFFNQGEQIKVNFVPDKGELRVYAIKKICKTPSDLSSEISLTDAKKIDANASLENYIEIDLPSEMLGRIAAQAAKQVIFQKVRNAEQEKIYAMFAPRLGEIVTGVLRRFEPNKNMVIEYNKVETVLLQRETLPGDDFRRGDRVKAVVLQVLREEKGHQVILSRTSTRFLQKLLELEIPEISNGNIKIKNICRQPGDRSKVAVYSPDRDIDPIGACIGVKGNRILAISSELRGEKIDVVEWSDNPLDYAKSALSPAKPDRLIMLSRQNKILQAIVPNDQLSLAIGKKGMNVRLASRLVGWKIEIRERQQ